ncbi:acyl carrier protein [Kitasatospora misakiensis]|uniref:Acyl carrier protein n=1 Tax=Kitasatospora misakiensis TaxID=67330 RepID=A0ABW0X845_9ACTN
MLITESVLAGLAEIVDEITGITAEDLLVEKSFTDDLKIDFLCMIEIAIAAEDKFGVDIPNEMIGSLRTVGDAVEHIVNSRK